MLSSIQTRLSIFQWYLILGGLYYLIDRSLRGLWLEAPIGALLLIFGILMWADRRTHQRQPQAYLGAFVALACTIALAASLIRGAGWTLILPVIGILGGLQTVIDARRTAAPAILLC